MKAKARKRRICPQCGKGYSARSCGPTHAIMAAGLSFTVAEQRLCTKCKKAISPQQQRHSAKGTSTFYHAKCCPLCRRRKAKP